MHGVDDYYRILQVHFLAEPEVIEGAYKRLAKKYHPDLNRNTNTEAVMAKINQAYEVLRDPEQRRRYNLVWKEYYGNTSRRDTEPGVTQKMEMQLLGKAKQVMEEYFRCIMDKRYDSAYELLSDHDKRKNPKADFISWQTAVAKLYQLYGYDCRICGVHRSRSLNGRIYSNAVDFNVLVEEYNAVMDLKETENSAKTAVLEDGNWRIYLGYETLQPLIEKFRALSCLLLQESEIRELAEIYVRNDAPTGLLNRKGILERLEREKDRHDRYGNVFSLVLCTVGLKPEPAGQEAKEQAILLTSEILRNSLRKTDIIGRWSEDSFLVILPETDCPSALQAIGKISGNIKNEKLSYQKKTYTLSLQSAATAYAVSVEASLDKIVRHIRLKKHG